jgi:hypothetical protein
VKDFLERGLLLQQDLVAVKNVQLLDLPRNIVQQTRDSQLMVDPDAAAQKGLAPNEKGAAEWRNVLQMWQRGSAAKRQKASHSHASQQGQQQQQQRQPVQSQAGAKQLAQDEALQQRRRELQEKQQRQQQRILQQQQQQRLQPGQGAVGAAPGLKPAQQHVVQDSQATIPYPAPSSWV